MRKAEDILLLKIKEISILRNEVGDSIKFIDIYSHPDLFNNLMQKYLSLLKKETFLWKKALEII